MKKIILPLFATFFALVTSSCNNNEKSSSGAHPHFEVRGADSPTEANGNPAPGTMHTDSIITVGKENFDKLVAYIEKNGVVSVQKGIPCDHRYSFFTTDSVQHIAITIKRDAAGQPSIKGKVNQISVWAYEKGKGDQKHFFGYDITAERANTFINDPKYQNRYFNKMKRGYKELLVKVDK